MTSREVIDRHRAAGRAEGWELGDRVAQDIDRRLGLDCENGLVDPFSGQGPDGPRADEHPPVAIGQGRCANRLVHAEVTTTPA